MKIALAQIKPILGNVEKNLDIHGEIFQKARREKADLLVFPELSLTGYTLKDMVPEIALQPASAPLFRELEKWSRELSLVVGFAEEKEKGIYTNSAAYIEKGQITHIHRKAFLPTYGMFEEGKFFARGKTFSPFITSWGKAGLMICYEFLFYGVGYLYFSAGADLFIAISAAPGRGMELESEFESSRMWELMAETLSRFSTAFVLYCNRVGVEDGKTFAGGSFVYGPKGNRLAKAPDTEEHLLIVDIQLDDLREARKHLHYRRDNHPEIILENLRKIVQNED
jgi:NAD+ synthase (glutamine-hydrolysing)